MAKLTDTNAFEGESLAADFRADGATGLTVNLANGTTAKNFTATRAGDLWHIAASPTDLKGLTGRVRWVAFASKGEGSAAETNVIANGEIYIRPLVSQFREVIAAIDEAIKSWDTNPNHTVTVGEITITAKTRDDLIKARAFWQGRADADEAGTKVTSGPRRVLTCFGRY